MSTWGRGDRVGYFRPCQSGQYVRKKRADSPHLPRRQNNFIFNALEYTPATWLEPNDVVTLYMYMDPPSRGRRPRSPEECSAALHTASVSGHTAALAS